jgi:RNA polymerase sigma-70 factor (ECF subfamily)
LWSGQRITLHLAGESPFTDSTQSGDALEAAADPSGPLLLKELARAIEYLPFEQKQAIRLISFEGMRKTLGVPIGTVCSRLWRVRNNLRRLMGMKEDQPAQTDSVAA